MSATLTAPPTAPRVRSPQFTPVPVRFRWEQYEKMVESGILDGMRVMFIRGEVVTMAAMNEPHMTGISLTHFELLRIFGSGFYVRGQMPLRSGSHDTEPDLAVLVGGPRDYSHVPTSALLVVEVADSSYYYDTGVKAGIYAAAGLADYWVLDVEDRRLLVFRDPAPTGYQSKLTLEETDSVSPLAAPTATIKVVDLLP